MNFSHFNISEIMMILVVINKLIQSLWSGTCDGNDSLVTCAQIWSQFFIFHHFNKVLSLMFLHILNVNAMSNVFKELHTNSQLKVIEYKGSHRSEKKGINLMLM